MDLEAEEAMSVPAPVNATSFGFGLCPVLLLAPVSSLMSISGLCLGTVVVVVVVERALEEWERALPGRRGCMSVASGVSSSESLAEVEVEVAAESVALWDEACCGLELEFEYVDDSRK